MNNINKDSVIPFLSLLAGVAFTCLVVAWTRQPQSDLQAAIDRFNQLSPEEQDNARHIAASFRDSEQKKARIEAIHTAVHKNPALLTKLETLNELLKTVDEETRAKLKPSGKFAPAWVSMIEDLYRQRIAAADMIEIRLPDGTPGPPGLDREPEKLQVTQQQFEDFLNAALPSEIPETLQEKLGGFDHESQSTERALTKLIWLMQHLLTARSEEIDTERIVQAALAHLTLADDRERIGRALRWTTPPPRPEAPENGLPQSAERMRQFQAMFVRGRALWLLKEFLSHYEQIFHETHLPANSDPADAFDQERRDRQLALMRMDPAEAAKMLDGEIIKRNSFDDPAIAGLSKDLNELKRHAETLRRGRGGFGGRWSDRSRGDGGPPRGDDGRRGERPSSERDPSERDRFNGDAGARDRREAE